MFYLPRVSPLICLLCLLRWCFAYTWVERTLILDDHSVLEGSPGFPRGNSKPYCTPEALALLTLILSSPHLAFLH